MSYDELRAAKADILAKIEAELAAADAHGNELNAMQQRLQQEIPTHNQRVNELVAQRLETVGALKVIDELIASTGIVGGKMAAAAA